MVKGSTLVIGKGYYHVHMISDATGETLLAVARAAAAQYSNLSAVEHVYPLVRSNKQIEKILNEIETSPGIVLYTMIDRELSDKLETRCKEFSIPCLSVLDPVLATFQSYLGAEKNPKIGAQHELNADYFKRINALNFTMLHDDGQQFGDLDDADVILVGISRTSKTPTSIYLANRGISTANVPLIPGIDPPKELENISKSLVVGLIASPERIVQIRRNRMLSAHDQDQSHYVDRATVLDEIAYTRKICSAHNWPIIDVTRRSIEETAASVISLLHDRQLGI